MNFRNLQEDLNQYNDELLHRKLVENAITLVKNEEKYSPIKNLDKKNIAYVKFGDAENADFVTMLKNYTKVDVISSENLDELMQQLKTYNLVIVGFHKSNLNPWKSYEFEDKELVWLQEIARKKEVILDVFASPYSLLKVKTFKNINGF